MERNQVMEQLRAELDGLRARQAKLEDHLRRPVSADSEEAALEREGDEVVQALDDAASRRLTQLQDAISRINDGTWGVCEGCGDEIEPGRLAVLPTASRCTSCAS